MWCSWVQLSQHPLQTMLSCLSGIISSNRVTIDWHYHVLSIWQIPSLQQHADHHGDLRSPLVSLVSYLQTNRLKWITLQMADLIYSMLIVLVPISECDIFRLSLLKRKQKLWIFVFVFQSEKVQGVLGQLWRNQTDRGEGLERKWMIHLSFIPLFAYYPQCAREWANSGFRVMISISLRALIVFEGRQTIKYMI